MEEKYHNDSARTEMVHGFYRSGSGKGQVAGVCECGNVPSGSIKWRLLFCPEAEM